MTRNIRADSISPPISYDAGREREREEHLHKFGCFAPHSQENFVEKVSSEAEVALLPSLDSIRPQNVTGVVEEKRKGEKRTRERGQFPI